MRHITGFYSHGKPKLMVRDGGDSHEFGLWGCLDMELSFNSYCIGYRRMGGEHPCADGAVSRYRQCRKCRKLELSCASCRGVECLLGPGKECMLGEHYVYLACFGGIVKAGVTKKERMEHRLVEQGADFGAVVSEAKDGLEARRAERMLQVKFGFRNAVRTSEKFKRIGEEKEKTKEALELALEKIGARTEVIDLSSFYPKLGNKPVMDEELRGVVLGAKGNLLFLERSGVRCLDMGKTIGRYITKEGQLPREW